MKKISLLFIFTFSTFYFFAQDTIFKRNNDKVVAKISEITSTEIKYKRFDNQDGPLYIDRKREIKMIVYSNGMKELFEEEKALPPINQSVTKVDNTIEDLELRYRYHGRYINQPQMQKILMDTKDKKIMSLVAQAQDARKMEFIGFAAIPLGVIAIANIEYNVLGNGNGNSDGVYVISGVCIAAAIACPIISGQKRKQKVRCNSQAINLYNQKF